jgi:hypothetical protein
MLVVAAAGGTFLVLVALRRRKADALDGQGAATATASIGAAPPVRSSIAPVESQVPRWLRPSVRAARFESDHIKAPRPDRARLTFAAPGDDATERLVVRYDLVQLLDRPDEALGVPNAELDAGDEVEVLERDAIWARVQMPGGRAGWVPAMTLAPADAVIEDPGTEMPLAGETDGAAARDDQPALETLLAIAAERRARIDAQSPVGLDDARHQAAKSRSKQSRKSRKANRRGR